MFFSNFSGKLWVLDKWERMIQQNVFTTLIVELISGNSSSWFEEESIDDN